jgi:hypothetical protein
MNETLQRGGWFQAPGPYIFQQGLELGPVHATWATGSR